jgi:threonine synthase
LGYLADPHTAVGYHAFGRAGDAGVPNIIISTASPYKFASDVCEALDGSKWEGFAALEALHALSGVPVPGALKGLRSKDIRHKTVCGKNEMKETLGKLGIFGTKNP